MPAILFGPRRRSGHPTLNSSHWVCLTFTARKAKYASAPTEFLTISKDSESVPPSLFQTVRGHEQQEFITLLCLYIY